MLRLPSPAMAVAVVALVFAAAGTSYAVSALPKNSVGSAQLKKRSVTTPKLAKTAAARIAGLTYKKVPFDIPAQSAGSVDAPCPHGLIAIGGGLESAHAVDAPMILDSHPTPTGWQVAVGNPAAATQTSTVYAICASAAPGAPKVARTAQRRYTVKPSR